MIQVTVELKNDLAITGTLHSVDQYLNVKLNNVRVVNEHKYPHMVSLMLSKKAVRLMCYQAPNCDSTAVCTCRCLSGTASFGALWFVTYR